MPSDDGIAFYNSQMLTSVTPITDFQQQVAAATSRASGRPSSTSSARPRRTRSELTIIAVIRPTGLSICPSYQPQRRRRHQHDPAAAAARARPGDRRRWSASTSRRSPRWSRRTRSARSGRTSCRRRWRRAWSGPRAGGRQRNATLAQYLIGDNRAAFRNILIEGLSLRSRPENALIGGKLEYLNAGEPGRRRRPAAAALRRPDRGRLGRPAPQLDHDQLHPRLPPERRRQGRSRT